MVLIGSGSSASDITRDISKVAKEIHLASRSPNAEVSKLNMYHNVWQHKKVIWSYYSFHYAFNITLDLMVLLKIGKRKMKKKQKEIQLLSLLVADSLCA